MHVVTNKQTHFRIYMLLKLDDILLIISVVLCILQGLAKMVPPTHLYNFSFNKYSR